MLSVRARGPAHGLARGPWAGHGMAHGSAHGLMGWPWPGPWPDGPGPGPAHGLGPGPQALGPHARSRVRAFMFPRATSEGFLLSASTAGAELRVPAGCAWAAVGLRLGCRCIETYGFVSTRHKILLLVSTRR